MDLETERGREVWRLLKANSVAFSFGYLTVKSHDEDGVRVLDVLDVFEFTVTPSPANNRTRVLGLKSASNQAFVDREWEMFREADAKAQAAHEKARMDREIEELAEELEAKRLREEKRNRPIVIRSFEV